MVGNASRKVQTTVALRTLVRVCSQLGSPFAASVASVAAVVPSIAWCCYIAFHPTCRRFYSDARLWVGLGPVSSSRQRSGPESSMARSQSVLGSSLFSLSVVSVSATKVPMKVNKPLAYTTHVCCLIS